MVLAARYARTMRSDRSFVRLSAITPVVMALLGRAVPDNHGLVAAGPADAGGRYLLIVLVFGAAFTGAINAAREVVKERDLFRREALSGQPPVAYLASKVMVLAAVTTVQVAAFTVLSLIGRPLPHSALLLGSPELEIVVAVVVAGVASMAVGLAISAWARSADNAMLALLCYIMVQLVFCGGLVPVAGRVVVNEISWACPARWSLAMAAATSNLEATRSPAAAPDILWRHSSAVWSSDLVFAFLLGAIALAAAWMGLRRSTSLR